MSASSLPIMEKMKLINGAGGTSSPLSGDRGSQKMVLKGLSKFVLTLKDYYNTDTFSDMVIVCDGQEFKTHSIILSLHSKYFATLLNGNWKESIEKRIEITDFDTTLVEAMLRYMYRFNYNDVCAAPSMIFDAQVYQIADKYDISGLKEHAIDRFNAAVSIGWKTDDFPLAITIVYESTPLQDRGLRDVALEVSRKNIDQLLELNGFRELIRSTPDFSADLIPVLCTKPPESIPPGGVWRYECPSCSHKFPGEVEGGYYYCPSCGRQFSSWHRFRIEE